MSDKLKPVKTYQLILRNESKYRTVVDKSEYDALQSKLDKAVEGLEKMHSFENWDDAYPVLVKLLSEIRGEE